MKRTCPTRSAATLLLFLLSPAKADPDALYSDLVSRRADGLRVVRPPEMPEEHNNPWTRAERERWIRQSDAYLDAARGVSSRGNTYFENEKHWYGYAMLHFLATGNPESLKALQQRDHQHQEWHSETAGIDWYACFTIKHQIRKYFQFGPGLDPDYRKQMFEGAANWTERDPLGRDHYAFQPENRNKGWGPNARNSWVDVRTTDNLRWMRMAAVYLMAEETGNEETRELYEQRIRRFVVALYRVGTGEWDSHNYLSHTIAPIHSLYDFAKDPEVRLLAKAALDHYYTAAAVKYRNGNWNGPTKRDYNAIRPMTAAPAVFDLHFGQSPLEPDIDTDAAHVIPSAYRPPMAVLALARKENLAGTELFISHAPYSPPGVGNHQVAPAYHETQYFGHTYQLGTLARGTREPDANGFKLVADDPDTGAEMLQLVPGPDPLRPGSPQYQDGKLFGVGRVAQYENLALYLVRGSDVPWTWVVPNSTRAEIVEDILFLSHANTWVAFRPLNLDLRGEDPEKTERLRRRERRFKLSRKEVEEPPADIVPGSIHTDDRGRTWARRKEPRHPDYRALSASGPAEGGWCGFAVEVGEPATHGSYADFKAKILADQKIQDRNLAEGRVVLEGSRGKLLSIRAEDPLTEAPVVRDADIRNFAAPWFKYRNAKADTPAPVYQEWGGGKMTVIAGGHRFECLVSEKGEVSFTNELANP